ncbi:MAG TPA: ATP-binding cassette domain-containing protein [Candidatus Omnitrophota bacterium]|nr:ATP-binding cassette domain-containing protein [Candidatus Omnitrophota bacterium]
MIEYKQISLNFGFKTIFKNFSLGIRRGEKVVIRGTSGLGKSSLFALALGFILPQSGHVLFDRLPLNEDSVWDIRRKVAFVDQDVSIGNYKIADWFALVSGFEANRSLDFSNKTIKELLDFFELSPDTLEKGASDLSGGERQRAALLVSVLLKRDVFFLDEATSALDKNLKRKVATFFTGRADWTVLSISHDPVWLDSPSVRVFDLAATEWKQ